MNQQTRNKVGVILAAILVPLMFYLLFTNIKDARKRRRPSADDKNTEVTAAANAQASITDATAILKFVQQAKKAKVENEPIDPDILKKQQEIALLSPKRNPFGASASRLKRPNQRKAVARRQTLPKLNAIVPHNVPGKRMAMINGKMVREGSRIGEWTIVRINNRSVVLDNGTRKATMTLR